MKHKRPYLLANARRLPTAVDISNNHYDNLEQLNISYTGEKPKPLVLDANDAWTSSKTEALPGDDDPDPEAEGCY